LISIEEDIGDVYLPDVVAFDSLSKERDADDVIFWGESGRVSSSKAVDLAERFPHTHIVHLVRISIMNLLLLRCYSFQINIILTLFLMMSSSSALGFS